MLPNGCELERRSHMVNGELRKVGHDLIAAHPGSEVLEHVVDGATLPVRSTMPSSQVGEGNSVRRANGLDDLRNLD